MNISQLGYSLSIFFVATYLFCIALGVIVPDWEMHKPWLQFFPGFEWLTLQGFVIGLVESVVYAWYVAIVFGVLFNFFGSRRTA
ncbi:MAG: hypothetical protein K0U74_16765 [Alphaproteobacteria bacterium]|nr:hypothetical protein [Alphaproteobacteria bacterium]